MKLSYDGSSFHGWQRQPNASSVQQTIEDALSVILRRPVDIVGAGRTDAGVHASEMFAHLDLDDSELKDSLLRSLNRMVGNHIAIDNLYRMMPEAHARFDALSRSYEYRISLKKDPFNLYYAHRLERFPDIDLMNKAAAILLQVSDFTSFAKLHSDSLTNICKVVRASWRVDLQNQMIFFNITADRFLRNMVRAVVGTLLEVGTGKLSIAGFRQVIESKDRCMAGVSMPAKGLFLYHIEYPSNIFYHDSQR